MTTLEDIRRMADALGHRDLSALITRATQTRRIPADLLAECERAAGVATACSDNQEATRK